MDIDVTAHNQDYPAIAYNALNNEFLIVYQSDNLSISADIVGRRYRLSDHTLLPPVTIASSGANQYRTDPDVAYNPSRNTYFITYSLEDTAASKNLLIGRGASFDLGNLGPEVDIASGSPPYIEPAIAAGADGYLVAWSTLDYIYGRLVSGDGIPIGPANGFPIPSAPVKENYLHPDVAYLGSATYLVTWHYFDPFTADVGDIYAQYVNAQTGSLIGPNIPMDLSLNLQRNPSVACSSIGACLVAYEHNAIAFPGGDHDIRGRLVFLFKTLLPIMEK